MSFRTLSLRALVGLLVVLTVLAVGGRANNFPDYPFGDLTEPEKISLSSWAVIGQRTSWCVCMKAGKIPQRALFANEEYAKTHSQLVKAILRNPDYLRECEKETRYHERTLSPLPPDELPAHLRMPAWWYMVFYYKIHDCHCEERHSDPNYDSYVASAKCMEEAQRAASSMLVLRTVNPPSSLADPAPENWPDVPYLPPPPRQSPNEEGGGAQEPRLFSSLSEAAAVPRGRSLSRDAAAASLRRALAGRVRDGRDAFAAVGRQLRDPEGLRRRVGAFAGGVRKVALEGAAARLRGQAVQPQPVGLGQGGVLNVPAVPAL